MFVSPAGPDGMLGFDTAAGIDRALDDDFHLLPGSPGIDRGDPAAAFDIEPDPNGARVNVGAFGNTAEATTSPPQLVQILSPNGLEKFEIGQQVLIEFRGFGLEPAQLLDLELSIDGGMSFSASRRDRAR